MARLIKPLTSIQVKNAKPGEKTRRLFDGGGLYLEVTPKGSKLWRMKFRQENGKENVLSFGKYPEVTLEQARQRRDEARSLRAAGIDPAQNKKAQKVARHDNASNSFEVVAREWFAKQAPTWVETHASRVIARLQTDVFPWLGSRAIAGITAPEYLAVFRRIEERGAVETAHRVKSICGQVCRYAVATGRAESDPTASLKGALPPVKVEHFAAITDPAEVGALLRMIDGFKGTFTVLCALKLAPLVFVRPGELRAAEWADFDLDKGEWRFHVTKTNSQHIVPLSRQALAILRELHAVTGRGRYLFPGARTNGRPMSDNAINAAFRRMGVNKDEMTAHGFRAMARTLLDEVLGFRPDLIEHQLAHAVKDALGRAYNRTSHLKERTEMMQKWADYLDELKS